MPELRGELSLNDKPFVDGMRRSQKEAKTTSDSLKNLFGREPVPERRAKRAFESIVEGLADTGANARNASEAVAGVVSNLRLGLGLGAVFGTAAIGITAVAKEAEDSKTALHDLLREGGKIGRELTFQTSAEGADKLFDRYKRLRQEVRHLNDEESKYSLTRRPIRGFERFVAEGVRGVAGAISGHPHTRQDVQIENELQERLKNEAKTSRDLVQAAQLSLSLTREQLHGTQEQATAMKINLDMFAKVAELRKQNRPQGEIDAVKAEAAERVKSLQAEYDSSLSQFKSQQEILSIRDRMLATDHERLEISRAETAEAEKQVLLARNLDEKTRQQRQNELTGARQRQRTEEMQQFFKTPAERVRDRNQELENQRRLKIFERAGPEQYPGSSPHFGMNGEPIANPAYERNPEAYGAPGDPSSPNGKRYKSQLGELSKHLVLPQGMQNGTPMSDDMADLLAQNPAGPTSGQDLVASIKASRGNTADMYQGTFGLGDVGGPLTPKLPTGAIADFGKGPPFTEMTPGMHAGPWMDMNRKGPVGPDSSAKPDSIKSVMDALISKFDQLINLWR